MNIDTIERDLRTYTPAGLPNLPADFVWPRYEGHCVGNLAATVVEAMGGEMLPGALPPLADELRTGPLEGMFEGVERIILMVVDALGWLQLRRAMARYDDLIFHRLAEVGALVPITTTFLSTTNSVLSAIWTGYPPVKHGLLAYELYLREWMMAVEAIGFSSPFERFSNTLLRWGFDPEDFLPVPSVGQVLFHQGLTSVAVILNQYTTTPLSQMHFRGAAEVRGHSYASDLWVALRRALAAHRGKKLLLGGYWPAVDTLAHRYGPEDETGTMEIRALSMLMEELFFEELPPEDREGTLFLMTADHGQILTPPSAAVVMTEHRELQDMLWLPPVGEGRVPFFYTRSGHEGAAWDYLQSHFVDDFLFLSREQLLGAELLGPGEPYDEVPFRLGDIIGLARRDGTFSRTPDGAKRLQGRHGGMSPEEMLVPLLAVRLDG